MHQVVMQNEVYKNVNLWMIQYIGLFNIYIHINDIFNNDKNIQVSDIDPYRQNMRTNL